MHHDHGGGGIEAGSVADQWWDRYKNPAQRWGRYRGKVVYMNTAQHGIARAVVTQIHCDYDHPHRSTLWVEFECEDYHDPNFPSCGARMIYGPLFDSCCVNR